MNQKRLTLTQSRERCRSWTPTIPRTKDDKEKPTQKTAANTENCTENQHRKLQPWFAQLHIVFEDSVSKVNLQPAGALAGGSVAFVTQTTSL